MERTTGKDAAPRRYIGFRVSPELDNLIQIAAKHEGRKPANLLRKAVVDWLKANGYRPEENSGS